MNKLESVAQAFARVFATHEGKIVLDSLRINFKDRKMVSDQSTNAMIIKAAQHDVVNYIENMIDVGNNGSGRQKQS